MRRRSLRLQQKRQRLCIPRLKKHFGRKDCSSCCQGTTPQNSIQKIERFISIIWSLAVTIWPSKLCADGTRKALSQRRVPIPRHLRGRETGRVVVVVPVMVVTLSSMPLMFTTKALAWLASRTTAVRAEAPRARRRVRLDASWHKRNHVGGDSAGSAPVPIPEIQYFSLC